MVFTPQYSLRPNGDPETIRTHSFVFRMFTHMCVYAYTHMYVLYI